VFLTDFYIAYFDSCSFQGSDLPLPVGPVEQWRSVADRFVWCWKSGLFELRQLQLSLEGQRLRISDSLVKQCRLRVRIPHFLPKVRIRFDWCDQDWRNGHRSSASGDVLTINFWCRSLEHKNTGGVKVARRGDGGSGSTVCETVM
jgi:hypothetical protein